MKEEGSDQRHRSGYLLQQTGEGANAGYGGSNGADGSRMCDGYGGSVGNIGHA